MHDAYVRTCHAIVEFYVTDIYPHGMFFTTELYVILHACSNTGNDVDVEVMFLFTYFGYYSNLITLLSQYNNIH